MAIGDSALAAAGEAKDRTLELCTRVAAELPTGARAAIIHGLPSSGHKFAQDHGLSGLESNQHRWAEFRHTVDETVTSRLVESLLSRGHSPIVVPATGIVRTYNGKIMTLNHDFVGEYAKSGFIPITHGDVVLDEVSGVHMVGCDAIAAHLAKNLGADLLVYCGVTDGVTATDGTAMGSASATEALEYATGKARNNEGLAGILGELSRLKGVRARIINIYKDAQLSKAMEGKDVGTLIR